MDHEGGFDGAFVFQEVKIVDEREVYLGGKPCLHGFFEDETEEKVPEKDSKKPVVHL